MQLSVGWNIVCLDGSFVICGLSFPCLSIFYNFSIILLQSTIGARHCAEAIRCALDEYNKCATTLHPPRDQISWSKIVDTVFLAELDILKDARQDIRQLKWADPMHREAALLHFNILRAQEEICRLNVEIRRLLTAMLDEHIDFMRAIEASKGDQPLITELRRLWQIRDRLNAVVASRLVDTSRLKGFTGN